MLCAPLPVTTIFASAAVKLPPAVQIYSTVFDRLVERKEIEATATPQQIAQRLREYPDSTLGALVGPIPNLKLALEECDEFVMAGVKPTKRPHALRDVKEVSYINEKAVEKAIQNYFNGLALVMEQGAMLVNQSRFERGSDAYVSTVKLIAGAHPLRIFRLMLMTRWHNTPVFFQATSVAAAVAALFYSPFYLSAVVVSPLISVMPFAKAFASSPPDFPSGPSKRLGVL